MNQYFTSMLCLVASPLLFAGDVASITGALTLHASFDHGPDADFSKGDGRIYSYSSPSERSAGGIPGLTDATVRVDRDAGLSGGALRFTRKVDMKPFFKAPGVLDYNQRSWSGSVSVWLRIDPDRDLEPGYCDPIMIVGGHRDLGFIFMEWSKDERPRLFRYAVLPRKELWNPSGVPWAELSPSQRPAVEVAAARFSRTRWTHAVFTFDRLNAGDEASGGSLYLDGILQGTIDGWNLKLGWEASEVILVLGASYVGWMDELSVFNRVLTPDEVTTLYGLRGRLPGVSGP